MKIGNVYIVIFLPYLSFTLCLVSVHVNGENNLENILTDLKAEMQIQMDEKITEMTERMKKETLQLEEQMTKMAVDTLKLQRQVTKLKAEIQQCKANNTRVETKRVLVDESVTPVAFSARLTRTLTGLADNQVIIFDEEVSDFGNNYENSDGIFTAPVSGFYVFTWTIGTHSDRNQATALVKHGLEMAYSYSDSSDNDGAQTSNTVVIQVNAGDHVMIKTTPWSPNDHVIDHVRANTFSGWLLRV